MHLRKTQVKELIGDETTSTLTSNSIRHLSLPGLLALELPRPIPLRFNPIPLPLPPRIPVQIAFLLFSSSSSVPYPLIPQSLPASPTSSRVSSSPLLPPDTIPSSSSACSGNRFGVGRALKGDGGTAEGFDPLRGI